MRTRRTRNYAAQTMESSSISFGELAKQFLEDRKARGNASQTIKHYGQSIRKLETFFAYRTCGKEEYTLLTREEAIDCGASVQCSILDEKNLDSSFRSFLYEVEGLGEQTVNTYFRDYRVIVYYAIDQQLVRERNIIVKSAETGVKDVYTADELEKLLRKPDQDCIFSEYRNWVVVNYLLATGNRVGTIVNLKISDLDFDDYMIAVNTQKNKRKTRIPMEREQLAKILRHYIDEWLTDENGRYTTEFLFPSSYAENDKAMNRVSMGRAIANYNKSRGVNKTSIHLFRHTFAKNWIIHGGDLHSLQRILGHSTLDMVVHYANLYDTDLNDKVAEFSTLSQFQSQGHHSLRKRQKS